MRSRQLRLRWFIVTAYGQVRLNRWNQPFYDALSRRDLHEFAVQLVVFAVIVGALLLLNVAQRWLGEMLKLKLREGLVHDMVEGWMQPRRAFHPESAGPIGVNPDQRVHEDAPSHRALGRSRGQFGTANTYCRPSPCCQSRACFFSKLTER